MQLRDLIEKAALRAGSHRALAERLNVTPQRLNDWKHGHRSCPPEAQGKMAEVAGEDAREWVWHAVMGKAAALLAGLGVVVTLTFGPTGDARAAVATGPNV